MMQNEISLKCRRATFPFNDKLSLSVFSHIQHLSYYKTHYNIIEGTRLNVAFNPSCAGAGCILSCHTSLL